MRRSLVPGIVAMVVVIAACTPAGKPPHLGATRRSEPQLYERDTGAQAISSARDGEGRVVVWGRRLGGLLLDRLDASGAPIGHTVLVDAGESDLGWVDQYWDTASLAVGGGAVLAAAQGTVDGIHGYDFDNLVVGLVSRTGRHVGFSGIPDGGLRACDHANNPWGYADVAMVWAGSSFLFAKGCADETDLFRISTTGTVQRVAVLPAATHVSLAASNAGAVLAYVVGHTRIRAQRLTLGGAPVGEPLHLDSDPVAGEVTVAASGASFLAAWTVGGAAGTGDLLSTTIGPDGRLGTRRELSVAKTRQHSPAIAGSAGGGWFTAWTDERNGGDVYGTAVGADGVIATPGGRPLASLPDAREDQPSLTRGPVGTSVLTWVRSDPSASIGLSRAFGTDAVPVGDSTQAARRPVVARCRDVAAGNGQFLVTWHEARPGLGAEPYAQRYGAAGDRVGPVIRLPGGPGDQFCPTAAWNGSVWLVVWADFRSGQGDIRGVTVSPTGAVSPSDGFAISGEPHPQRDPAVAAMGSTWLVAWSDNRNGNQDIYAARVAADHHVLDPAGIALRTVEGDQSRPTVAGAATSALVTWRDDDVDERVVRADGTLAGPTTKVGELFAGRYDSPPVAAGANHQLALLYRDGTYDPGAVGYPIQLVHIDPDDGSVGARVRVGVDHPYEFCGAGLSYDGTRFVFTRCLQDEEFPGAYGNAVGSVTGAQVRTGPGRSEFGHAGQIASLPSGRSLLVSDAASEPTVAVAPVIDAP
jgi:hypothetical protein